MRIVIQRVSQAKVSVAEKITAQIGLGFLILLGIEHDDTEADISWLVQKIVNLRVFNDQQGIMNLSVKEVDGSVLVVSQFTLHASTKKGNRPSYIKAARPEIAIQLYDVFVKKLSTALENPVETGIFGAYMHIELVNDGPVTILIDSKNRE